ncbi:MAG TPA: J domain-containing protein, partial [Polyangiaceae bacterium]|nr:J domain-containing protein [Polyangiaceae bacterium]
AGFGGFRGGVRDAAMRGADLRAVVELDFEQAIRGTEIELSESGPEPRSIKVRIPAGADDGSILRIEGKGAPGARGGPPGDLIIETRVRPHPLLERDGLDLSLKLPVRVDEAFLGAQVEVPTLDGTIKLRIPPRSRPGSRLRVRGKGVERGGKRGDLYVVLDLQWPDRETAEFADAVKRAAEDYQNPVRKGMRL